MKKSLVSIFLICAFSPAHASAETKPVDPPAAGKLREPLKNGSSVDQVQNAYTEIKDPPRVPLSKQREITPEAYARWNEIYRLRSPAWALEEGSPKLSADGRWVAYTIQSATGTAELVVRATRGNIEYRVPRGVRSKSKEDGLYYGDGTPVHPEDWPLQLTADARFVLFTIRDAHGHATLTAMHLPAGRVKPLGVAAAFLTPQAGGSHVAYRLADEQAAGAVVLRDLGRGTEVRLAEVSEFRFDAQGRYFAYAVNAQDGARSGVSVRRLADGQITALLRGPGEYRSLLFDEAGEQLAFLSTHAEHGQPKPRHALYHAAAPLQPAIVAVPASALPAGRVIAPASLAFTRAGTAISFHVTAAGQEVAAEKASSEELRFELWHWREGGSLAQGRRDTQKPAYLSVYHLTERRMVPLGGEATPEVLLTDDARHAIGIDRTPYPALHHRFGNGTVGHPWMGDVYRIDALTGERHLFRRALKASESVHPRERLLLSPGGRYLLYFTERRWWSLALESGTLRDLTGPLLPEERFTRQPLSQRLNYTAAGVVGWTAHDRRVLLYGERDLWEMDPTGQTPPRNLTHTMRLPGKLRFRLLGHEGPMRRPSPVLDTNRPILFSAVDTETMASGVWRLQPNGRLKKLIMVDKKVTPLAVARSGQVLLTMESFRDYPDLWTGADWGQVHKLSHVNPQQAEYRWGSVELVTFSSDWGAELTGRLYKPEGFDPTNQYPMVVSIYGEEHERLHEHMIPEPLSVAPGQWPVPSLVSRGYLYFVPDVRNASMSPLIAPATFAALIPAVQSLIDRGFVDKKRIALSGHSFGGYETAYLITQTNMFRCAIASAPATNWISYGGDPTGWGWDFVERGQAELGGPLWDRPWIHILNSPVFFADRVKTPLLMMHNDEDNAIPIGQGREFFSALRRSGREVYLFHYHGEGHGLRDPAARLDWDRRVSAFLDHFLKDAPRAEWMSREHLVEVYEGERFIHDIPESVVGQYSPAQ